MVANDALKTRVFFLIFATVAILLFIIKKIKQVRPKLFLKHFKSCVQNFIKYKFIFFITLKARFINLFPL